MKFFGKPIKFLKRKKDKEYSEILKENLDKLVPQYLEAHDLETRDKYLADRQRYLQEISLEVYKQVEGDIKEIKENSGQYKEVIGLLQNNMVDVLRQKIETIYYNYKDERQLPIYASENLEELYHDYKAAGGNHHIDKLYKRMKTWEVLPDTYDDEE